MKTQSKRPNSERPFWFEMHVVGGIGIGPFLFPSVQSPSLHVWVKPTAMAPGDLKLRGQISRSPCETLDAQGLCGYGSTLSHQKTAVFSPCVHLQGLHLGYLLTRTHVHGGA